MVLRIFVDWEEDLGALAMKAAIALCGVLLALALRKSGLFLYLGNVWGIVLSLGCCNC